MRHTALRLIRRASRLFAWSLLAFLLLGALASLFGDEPSTSTPIAALEAGMRPETEAIRVTDGMLFWPSTVAHTEDDLRTGEQELKGYYVPLVSGALAQRLALGDAHPGLDAVAALVYIRRETAERDFPWLGGKAPLPPAEPYEVSGPWKSARALPLGLKQKAGMLLPGLDAGRAMLIAHDAPDESLATLGGIGILALLIFGVTGKAREDRAAAAEGDPLLEHERAVMDIPGRQREGHDAQAGGLAAFRNP